MFKFGNVCYVNILFWDVLSGPWFNNNHIDLIVQFFWEKWIEISLILKKKKIGQGKYIVLIWKEKLLRKGKKITHSNESVVIRGKTNFHYQVVYGSDIKILLDALPIKY
jgi:hypothetical protein